MSDKNGDSETTAHGAGQAVTVVVSSGGAKWLVIGLIALVVLLLWTNHTSVSAELKANEAVKASENMQTEQRMTQFWMQRATVACQANGVAIPPIPASLK